MSQLDGSLIGKNLYNLNIEINTDSTELQPTK